MADGTNGTHKTLSYFNSGLLAILTGFVGWQQVELSNYRTNSEEERKQLLTYALEAKTEAEGARQSAKAAKDVAESTKATVDSTKKMVEGAKILAEQTKKAVESIQ